MISTGCLMIAQGPECNVKGSIGKECFWCKDGDDETFWRFGGGDVDIFVTTLQTYAVRRQECRS